MAFKNGVWEPENVSVADNVAKITSQDSQLMQQARGMGMKTAQRRGLINSTMAARAGEDAVISAATPIASQDAANATSMNQSWMGDQTQRRGQDIERETTTRGQDLNYSSTTRGQDLAAANEAAKLNQDKTNSLMDAIAKYNDSYSQMFSSIMNNTKMSESARTNYLTSAKNQLTAMQGLAQQLSGVQLNWGAPAPAAAAPSLPAVARAGRVA